MKGHIVVTVLKHSLCSLSPCTITCSTWHIADWCIKPTRIKMLPDVEMAHVGYLRVAPIWLLLQLIYTLAFHLHSLQTYVRTKCA